PTPISRIAPLPTPARRVSRLEMAIPLRRIEPVYPAAAIARRIQGKVRMLGVLGVDGRIHELRAIVGHPLLMKAALNAVEQWVYATVVLNGEPVEVRAPIEVRFVLHIHTVECINTMIQTHYGSYEPARSLLDKLKTVL